MKRLIVYGLSIAAALVVVIGGTVVVHQEQKTDKGSSDSKDTATASNNKGSSNSSSSTTPKNTACGLLTADVAQKLLDSSAKASQSNGLADSDNRDTKVTTCTYIKEGANPEAHEEISMQVHTAKTSLGARGNQTAFGSERPKGTTTVTGYGDAAFWNQSKGELNVLQHNTWYVFSILHDTSPSKTKLSEVEQFAKRILQQL